MRLERIDVQDQRQVKALSAHQSLRVQQDFALWLISQAPLHLYVVLQHSKQERMLLYPQPGGSPEPFPAGKRRLPGAGDWLFLEKVEAGDILCLIASEQPTSQLSCEPDKPGPGRGEDQGTPTPQPATREVKPAPPPPPADTDSSRGHGRWVFRLPLSSK